MDAKKVLLGAGGCVGLMIVSCCLFFMIAPFTEAGQRFTAETQARELAQRTAQREADEAAAQAAAAQATAAEAQARAAEAERARIEAEAQAARAAAAPPEAEPEPEPEPEAPQELPPLAQFLESNAAECQDEGPNQIAAHHCSAHRMNGMVLSVVSWDGERDNPERVIVALTYGERVSGANADNANQILMFAGVAAIMGAVGGEIPDSVTRRIDRPGTQQRARFRANGIRYEVEVARLRPTTAVFMFRIEGNRGRR